MTEQANLIVALGLKDGLSSGLGRASSQLKSLEQSGYRIGRGLAQVGSGLDRLLTRGAIAAGAALTGVVTTAISFEDAFAGVRKTVDATSGELDDLRQSFKDMTREIPLSFEELSGIGATAGALGIAKGDIIDFTRTVALLGVTTDVTTDQAATALGQLSNVLGLTADDFDNFGATLVDLGNKGASTESQILELASRAGAGAHLIGIANDATLGWSSAVANLGIEVEAGGTALQKFFLGSLENLQKDKTLNVMAETAGTTADAFKQAFEKDASGALTSFLKGMGKLSEAEQLAVLDALGFTDQRITRTLLGLAGNTDNLTESLNTASQAWKDNTALTTEAQKRFETTQSQLGFLKNNVRAAADTIGSELLPIIVELAKDFNDFLNKPETQRALKQFGVDLAGGIRNVIAELKGADFSGLIGGMKTAAEVAKGAFDLFNKLPPDIKALAIGALVVNKATGGAVGSIAKGLSNILIGTAGSLLKGGGLLGRGNSPLTPLYVQNVGLPGTGGVVPIPGVSWWQAALSIAIPLVIGDLAVQELIGGRDRFSGQNQSLSDLGLTPDEITAAKVGVGNADFRRGVARGGHAVTQADIDAALAKLNAAGFTLVQNSDGSFSLQPFVGESGPNKTTGSRSPFRKGDAVDPAIDRLVAARALPNTAFSPTETRDFAELPHITDKLAQSQTALREQGGTLRQILAKPNPPNHFTIPVSVNVNASLIASRIYQISTSARAREG